MMIRLRCEYTLRFRDRHGLENPAPVSFRHSHPSGRTVEVVISYSAGNALVAMGDVNVSEAVLAELRTLERFDGSKLSAEARAVFDLPLEEIRTTVRTILALIKYHLRHFGLCENAYSVKAEDWVDVTGDRRAIPNTLSVSIDNLSTFPLDETSQAAIQAALTARTRPLLAMRHLHRAKSESAPHHKWIDATIAAELAVKEVLCRANPGLEPLLVELPSPPLSKLYGSLLKRYLGETSPFRNALIAGQEKRNALIHRPALLPIDLQSAINYVNDVEGAIFHLLSLLYPNDSLILRAQDATRPNPTL